MPTKEHHKFVYFLEVNTDVLEEQRLETTYPQRHQKEKMDYITTATNNNFKQLCFALIRIHTRNSFTALTIWRAGL